MRRAERVRWWLIPLLALLLDLAVVFFVQPREAVRDEGVFYPAAQAFARAGVVPSLEFLRHYPAPQTPLSLYLAGRVLAVGSSLRLLRVLNSLLMSAALLRFSWFARRRIGKYAALATALLGCNPYFHLAATHFYTDALYFLLVVLVVTRTTARGAWLPLTLLPLARQYGVIFALGEAMLAVIERRSRAAFAALLTLLPVCALFAFWHGLAPDTPRAHIQTSVHAVYGWLFPYVAAYHVAALGFYLAPVAWCVPRTLRFWLSGAAFALFYLLAPAHQNFSATLAGSGITTLGYFQRAALLLGPSAAQTVLLAFAFVGGGLVGEAFAVLSAPSLFVALFIALSVLNFQAWDKYLLDVLPAALIALLARPSALRNSTASSIPSRFPSCGFVPTRRAGARTTTANARRCELTAFATRVASFSAPSMRAERIVPSVGERSQRSRLARLR